MAKYKVLVELDYPPDRHALVGDVVSDLPAKSIKWLAEQNLIELVGKADEIVEEEPIESAPADSKKVGK